MRSLLQNSLCTFRLPQRKARFSLRHHSTKLRLETLEDRLTPSTAITFSETIQNTSSGFNGQANQYLISNDGSYRVESFWINLGSFFHIYDEAGDGNLAEHNHDNAQGIPTATQGIRISRVDGQPFTLQQMNIFGQAAIGQLNNFNSGSGTFSLYNGSGTFSAPGLVSFGTTFANVSQIYLVDPSRAGGSSNRNSWDNIVLKINNDPPVADAGGPYSVAEGGTVALSATGSDPESDPITFAWDLDNNGTYETPGSNVTFSASTLDGDASYNVKVRVSDNHGNNTIATATVNVINVAPTATLGNNGPVNEGSPVTLSFTNPFDPSAADNLAGFHYSLATSPAGLAASYGAAGASSSGTLTFDDNGSYMVYGRIFDKDGGSNDYTTTVTVNNAAPSATFGNNGPVDEGSSVTVSFSNGSDASNADTQAGLHYSIALNQSDLAGSYGAAGVATSAQLTFDDNGSYTVYGRVFDKDGGSTDYTTTVTVNNVPPTATFGNDGPVASGSPVTVSMTNPFDPSSADTSAGFHYSFATTSAGLAATYGAAGASSSAPFTFNATGTYTVYGRIFDKDNGFTDYTTSVSVINTAPTNLTLNSGTISENGSFKLIGSFTDPDGADTHTVVITWGPGEGSTTLNLAAGVTSFSAIHKYLDDNPSGTPSDGYPIGVSVTDAANNNLTGSASVTVNNVAPAGLSLSGVGIAADGSYTLQGSFTDPGTQDTHAVVIHWGDGQPDTTLNLAAGVLAFSATHQFSLPAGVASSDDDDDGAGGLFCSCGTSVTFTIGVSVTDDDTGSTGGSIAARGGTGGSAAGVFVQDHALYVIGTVNDDHVSINKQGTKLKVSADFLSTPFVTFPYAGIDRIVVNLCSGDDFATVSSGVTLPAFMTGGEGNDHLNGGGGPNVLIGGPGDDMLVGGKKNDILIGGAGADRLVGNAGDDILLGGTTSYDCNLAALISLLNDWNAATPIGQRVARLSSGDDHPVLRVGAANATVFDDAAVDTMTGSAGTDWFFARVGGNLADVLTDYKPKLGDLRTQIS